MREPGRLRQANPYSSFLGSVFHKIRVVGSCFARTAFFLFVFVLVGSFLIPFVGITYSYKFMHSLQSLCVSAVGCAGGRNLLGLWMSPTQVVGWVKSLLGRGALLCLWGAPDAGAHVGPEVCLLTGSACLGAASWILVHLLVSSRYPSCQPFIVVVLAVLRYVTLRHVTLRYVTWVGVIL